MAGAARQLVASNPAAVVLGAFGAPAAKFIQAFKAAKGTGQVATFSGVGTDLIFKEELGVGAAGTIVSQIVPFPWSPAIPIVREYQAASKSAGRTTYSHIGLWGHISARVLVEALRRAGRDVSRERLVDTLEAMRNVDHRPVRRGLLTDQTSRLEVRGHHLDGTRWTPRQMTW